MLWLRGGWRDGCYFRPNWRSKLRLGTEGYEAMRAGFVFGLKVEWVLGSTGIHQIILTLLL